MSVRNAKHSAGFTLVELLVALAIFFVIMGSLAALLAGAVRTVNQGYALMNAMERARGAMSGLEADLKTAFVSPEKKQHFQFYGEPNGFLYSGQLVTGGFGRVTYAVHVDNAVPPMMGNGGYETVSLVLAYSAVAQQFAKVLCPVSPMNPAAVNIDKNSDGVHDITLAGLDAAPTAEELDAWNASKTSLVPYNGFDRYSERIFTQIYRQFLGVQPPRDFDDPVEFTLRIRRGVLLRYEERGQGSLTSFSDPLMTGLFASGDGVTSLVSPFGSASSVTSLLAEFPEATRERLDQLQQSHYWVRMLSGNLPLNTEVDPFLPLPSFWTEDGGTSGQSWRNYVVTEGILVSADLVIPETDRVVTAQNSAQGTDVAVSVFDMASFFSYGIEDGTDRKWFNTLWSMPGVSLTSDRTGAVVKPMFSYFLSGSAADFADALGVEVHGYSAGDPLKPRLPAWVAPGFWIFGDPPRTGAPPFHQWFQQKVDIPSAYLRQGAGT